MNTPVCGYYGKLPLSPEFLRLHAAGPELRELDEWFEHGVEYAKATAGSEWSALLTQADIWNFLFVPEGNGRVVCGAVFASRDRAGRSFPFMTFLLLERHDLPPTPWLIPLRCRTFLTRTRQFLQQLRADLDWNAFRASMESLPAEAEAEPDASIEARFEEYLSHTSTGEFWREVRVAADRPEHDGFGFERAARTHPVSTQSEAAGSWGLKLPLSQRENQDETYDLPFWLELQARLHGVKKGTWPALVAFWNRAPSKVEPCLLVSFGRSSPNLTRFIVTPDVQDNAWNEWQLSEVTPSERISAVSLPLNQGTEVSGQAEISLKRYLNSIG